MEDADPTEGGALKTVTIPRSHFYLRLAEAFGFGFLAGALLVLGILVATGRI